MDAAELRLCCCFKGKTLRAKLLKKSDWLLRLVGDGTPPTVRNSRELDVHEVNGSTLAAGSVGV